MAKFHQHQNFNQKRSEIPIRINTDADVCQISVQKCCGFHTLSESAISPSLVKIGSDCMRNANKSPMFRNGEENQKLIRNMYLGL